MLPTNTQLIGQSVLFHFYPPDMTQGKEPLTDRPHTLFGFLRTKYVDHAPLHNVANHLNFEHDRLYFSVPDSVS
jgi:hypothetical protein